MRHPVSFDFLERIQAACPEGSVTIVAYGMKLFELVKIEYGALYIRDATNFKLTDEELTETEDTRITGYWYLEREWNVGKKKEDREEIERARRVRTRHGDAEIFGRDREGFGQEVSEIGEGAE